MKKVLFIVFVSFLFIGQAIGQGVQVSEKQINALVELLRANAKSEGDIQEIVNGIIKDPELYNIIWKDFIKQSLVSKDGKFKFLNDLNITFKTFQSQDSATTSLGLSYDFNFDYARYKEKGNARTGIDFGLSANGNVAIKKEANPFNFLETKVHASFSRFVGGVVKVSDTAVFTELNDLEVKLAGRDMKSKEAIAELAQFNEKLKLNNQYYYAISPKFAYESNQDFSRTQFTPGATIDLGAKGWNRESLLSKLNVFDYPFALIRYITGTDKDFTVYGSTFPTAQATVDYVFPSNDDVRQSIVGNQDPFPRFKFETSFRTYISRISKENIFFNANYRYYQELSAPAGIRKAGMGAMNYFVMALQSTSGFYVSYAVGRLPFDAKNDEVYALGFNYKF